MIEVTFLYGRPQGIRDDGGYICFFTWTSIYDDQRDRFEKENIEQMRNIDIMVDALKKARGETPLPKVVVPKITYFGLDIIPKCECGTGVSPNYSIYCHKCGARLDWAEVTK